MGWNKTNVNNTERMYEIKNIIKSIKPAGMFIQELNLNEHKSKSLTNIKNYKFISDNLIITNKTARLGCWISNDIVFSKIDNLEYGKNPIIGLKIGYPNLAVLFVIIR